MLSKRDKKRLKSLLPHGSLKKIAAIVGVQQISVSNYFSGKYHSDRIEDAALEFYREYKEKKEKLIALMH